MNFNRDFEARTNPMLLEDYARDREITLFPFRSGTMRPLDARIKAQLIIGSEIALLRGPSGNGHLHVPEPLSRGRSIKRLGYLTSVYTASFGKNWSMVKDFFLKEAVRFDSDTLIQTSDRYSEES